MKPKHLVALKNVCYSQEDLQRVWDNPSVFNFTAKYQAYVTLCVVKEGKNKFVWTACVRLANPNKRNFKRVSLWTIQEKLKARTILFDQLHGAGALLGEEESCSTTGMLLTRLLTPEEKWTALRPEVLGS